MYKSEMLNSILDHETEIGPSSTPSVVERIPEHGRLYVPRLIWNNRELFGRIVGIGTLLTLVVVLLIPTRYESTARLAPPDSQSLSPLALMAGLAGGSAGRVSPIGSIAGNLLGANSSGALFEAILHSRTVEDNLIQRFDLRRVYWDKYWKDARKDLARRTEVSEDRKSGVITITISDHNPRRAQEMTRASIEELDRLVAQLSTSAAHRERMFIEGRLEAVKRNLNSASLQFSEFASKNGAVDIGAQTKAEVEAAAELQGQLIAARAELQGLQQIYSSNNVRIRAAEARIAELEKQLQNAGGSMTGREFNPEKELYPPLRELPVLGVKWAELYRDTKIQETVYELLTQQYEVAKIEEAKEIPTVKVLDEPDLAERKSFPPRTLLLILGFVLSCVAGIAFLAGRDNWKGMQESDLRKQFVREVLGTMSAKRAHFRKTRIRVSSDSDF